MHCVVTDIIDFHWKTRFWEDHRVQR